SYTRFVVGGVQRYRISTVEGPATAARALSSRAQLQALSSPDCEKNYFSYGPADNDPNGAWTLSWTTINNCRGDEYQQRYRTEAPLGGKRSKDSGKTHAIH